MRKAFLLLAVIGLMTGVAHSIDYSWTGANGQDWFDNQNWSPAGVGVPGAADRALIYSNLEQGGTRAGSGTATVTVGELICDNNAGLGFANGSTIIIDSSQGQSGDLTYFGTYWGI